jgi:IS30 family transposase
MRDYTQLTQEERYQIEALLKMGHHQSEIAVVLKRHKSTISREVGRNCGLRGYRPKQAQHLAPGPPRGQGQAEDCPRHPPKPKFLM